MLKLPETPAANAANIDPTLSNIPKLLPLVLLRGRETDVRGRKQGEDVSLHSCDENLETDSDDSSDYRDHEEGRRNRISEQVGGSNESHDQKEVACEEIGEEPD